MPFDFPQADAVPTRRSSRSRTAASEAPAERLLAPSAAPATVILNSRRAARDRAVSEARPVAEVVAPVELAASAAPVDAFAQASSAFRAVPGTPLATGTGSVATTREVTTGHAARRRPKGRKVIALGATVGVMSLAGLLAVSMTVPAAALAATGTSGTAGMSLVAASALEDPDVPIQAFVTSSDVQNEELARSEDFSTVSLVQVASEQGIKFSDSVFTNDPDAAIQWPFLVGVSMSSGFGPRWGRMHEGIDFTPGEGAPIQAIADGTVRIATEQGGGYGVTAYIDHVIDGKVITSHYSHMQYGSLQVKAGDKVKVGDIVGHTGNTGHSFGAHLHFEIIVNSKPIDPLPWLNANAGRASLD